MNHARSRLRPHLTRYGPRAESAQLRTILDSGTDSGADVHVHGRTKVRTVPGHKDT